MDSAEVAAYGRNIWAEQSVIGSMLIDPRVVGLVMAGLTEDDFLLEADQRLFRSFKARFVANQPIDSVLVCQAAAPGDKELNAYAIQAEMIRSICRLLQYGCASQKAARELNVQYLPS